MRETICFYSSKSVTLRSIIPTFTRRGTVLQLIEKQVNKTTNRCNTVAILNSSCFDNEHKLKWFFFQRQFKESVLLGRGKFLFHTY